MFLRAIKTEVVPLDLMTSGGTATRGITELKYASHITGHSCQMNAYSGSHSRMLRLEKHMTDNVATSDGRSDTQNL